MIFNRITMTSFFMLIACSAIASAPVKQPSVSNEGQPSESDLSLETGVEGSSENTTEGSGGAAATTQSSSTLYSVGKMMKEITDFDAQWNAAFDEHQKNVPKGNDIFAPIILIGGKEISSREKLPVYQYIQQCSSERLKLDLWQAVRVLVYNSRTLARDAEVFAHLNPMMEKIKKEIDEAIAKNKDMFQENKMLKTQLAASQETARFFSRMIADSEEKKKKDREDKAKLDAAVAERLRKIRSEGFCGWIRSWCCDDKGE